jgi:hypothetical protein
VCTQTTTTILVTNDWSQDKTCKPAMLHEKQYIVRVALDNHIYIHKTHLCYVAFYTWIYIRPIDDVTVELWQEPSQVELSLHDKEHQPPFMCKA